MGKSERSKPHPSTGYPYSPQRTGHVHVVRPAARSEDRPRLFVGLFLEPLPAHQEAFQAQAAWKPPSQLKRLQLVGSYGEYCNSRLGELYWESRKHLPSLLQSSVAAVESRVALVGSPVMQALQARSQKLLLQVDTKVDSLCSTAGYWLWPSSYRAHQALGQGLQLDSKAFARVGTAHELDASQSTSSPPAVSRLVGSARPSVEYAMHRYEDVHDALVASPGYKLAVDTAHKAVTSLQATSVYRVAARQFYPLISPVADPALGYLTHSPVVAAMVQHLTPQEAHAKCV